MLCPSFFQHGLFLFPEFVTPLCFPLTEKNDLSKKAFIKYRNFVQIMKMFFMINFTAHEKLYL